MSKAALSNLIEELEKSVREDRGLKADDQAVKRFRREGTNRYANAFRLNRKEFSHQTLQQINRTKGIGKLGPLDTVRIIALCNKYFDLIKATLIERGSRLEETQVVHDNDNVTLISYSKRALSNFDIITQQTVGSKAVLRNKVLQPFMQELNALLEKLNKGQLPEAFSSNYNLGHEGGSNVQYFISSRLSNVMDRIPDGTEKSEVLQDISVALANTNQKATVERTENIIIDALAKFHNTSGNGDISKVITLTLESRIANMGKDEDRGVREALASQLRSFVRSRPAEEWINQEASDSEARIIAKTLMQDAMKLGAKVENKRHLAPKDTRPSAAQKRLTKKNKTTVPVSKGVVNVKVNRVQTPRATPSYLDLMTLINDRLPPRVRANMGSPGLNNRTGRLSESARVVGITTTGQGFPSIHFTYQRDPYDVFDPVAGRQPWNTPERNPRTLVERSVRELATELGMGRFYTRRV